MKYLLLLLFLTGCADPCYFPNYNWGFNYEVTPTITTRYGISVDTTKQDLGWEVYDKIDKMTKEVEACLEKNFPDGDLSEIKKEGYCTLYEFEPECDKDCLRVKIPDDWHYSKTDPRQQLLADNGPVEGCRAKGFDTEEGDCYWRAGLQQGHIVITTPNLYLYKDPLIKYITRCENVWHTPELAECASPGVEPDWNE